MLIRKPQNTIRTWHTDTRIWDEFDLRTDDILVCTPPKTGTTWTQRIISMLMHQSAEPRAFIDEQPWLDARFIPQDEVAETLTREEGRRSLKSHSPLTALPLHDDVLYINVARDPRDAAMSFHNHSINYVDEFMEGLDENGLDDPQIARPFPRAPDDPRDFFRRWLRDPAFAPFDDFTISEFLELERSFWNERHRPNVLLVHVNDLKVDLTGEIRRIDAFLGTGTPEPLLAEIIEAAGFSSMKRDGEKMLGLIGDSFKGGTDTFMHKGTNERWKGVLTEQDLADYRAVIDASVPEDLAQWLEKGRLSAGDPTPLESNHNVSVNS